MTLGNIAENPIIAAHILRQYEENQVSPFINTLDRGFVINSDPLAASPKDSVATDDVYHQDLGTTTPAGRLFKSPREKLPPGIYSDGYIVINIPQVNDDLIIENGLAMIDYVQVSIGD